LLLRRSGRVSLHVRVQQTATVPVVLERELGSVRHLKWRLGKVVAPETGLEEGRHLRVARSRPIENEEVHLEASGVDDEREDDQCGDTRDPVLDVCALNRV
jgi:hypothetical protein